MAEPHPAHQDLPALYMAELMVWKGSWNMNVTGPGPEVVVDWIDLGPATEVAVGNLGDPGRYLVDPGPDPHPVPPVESATALLPEYGYVLAEASKNDPVTLSGWSQVGDVNWTAHCHLRK